MYYSSANSKNPIPILEKGYVKYEDFDVYIFSPKNHPLDKNPTKNEKKVFLNINSNCGNIYVCMFNAILQSNK